MDNFIGELAALGAALAFSFTSTFFTLAGRKLGAISSLAWSLPLSCMILMGVHLVTIGEAFPTSATGERWFDLGMSSIIGFVISSLFLLRAFQYIGPRLTLLVTSLSPVLSAILAWIFLDQDLPTNAILGISLVITGIIWVVSEGGKGKVENVNPDYRRGLMFALAGAFGQAFAFIFMSRGVAGDFPAMSASVMRAFVGAITLWILLGVQGNLGHHISLLRTEIPSMKYIVVASIVGPVIGASLVLVSLQFASVGVSSTLVNTSPIMLIPIGYLIFKERITSRAIMGTVVAIVGIAILFT